MGLTKMQKVKIKVETLKWSIDMNLKTVQTMIARREEELKLTEQKLGDPKYNQMLVQFDIGHTKSYLQGLKHEVQDFEHILKQVENLERAL